MRGGEGPLEETTSAVTKDGRSRRTSIRRIEKDGGGNRIRTYVGLRQRVYSPSPLATRASLHLGVILSSAARNAKRICFGRSPVELVEGIEPATARLQGECSTIELHQPSGTHLRHVGARQRVLSSIRSHAEFKGFISSKSGTIFLKKNTSLCPRLALTSLSDLNRVYDHTFCEGYPFLFDARCSPPPQEGPAASCSFPVQFAPKGWRTK